mmetsp:Transcript_16057/g.46225  ORF Transcript_16057/g.46225 Transcript_16057/m.46225 type:complete len:297 (-) Transcript_16057:8-898(-)
MEESKIQALHDTLSKLRRSAGLGVTGQYSWSAAPTKKDENGNDVREDGLPTNALYANFLPEGSYDAASGVAKKYGDGRTIKRNFDDCVLDGSGKDSISSDDMEGKRRQKTEKKERKKAEKKAAKMEAKRQAKVEEKRRLKREVKAAAKQSSDSVPVVTETKDESRKSNIAYPATEKAIKTAKKTLKRQESGSMKMKELAKAVAEKIDGHDVKSVKKLIEKSDNFEVEGKVVRFVNDKKNGETKGKEKKRKREETQEEAPAAEPPLSSSIASTVLVAPSSKKKRKKTKSAQNDKCRQ